MTKFFGHKTLIICILQCVLAKLYFATIMFQFWHGICQVKPLGGLAYLIPLPSSNERFQVR